MSITALYHFGVASFYIYVCYYLVVTGHTSSQSSNPNVKLAGDLTYRYLTNWSYTSQLIYFILCSVAHIFSFIGEQKLRNKLNQVANKIFTTIACPVAFSVTEIFWLIYVTDRELVYPEWIDQFIPVWINHSIHTLNSVYPFIDMLLVQHTFPKFQTILKVHLLFFIAYGICLYGTYFSWGLWIYPVLKAMNWTQRGILSVGNLLLALGSYWTAVLITRLRWGSAYETPLTGRKTVNQKSKKLS